MTNGEHQNDILWLFIAIERNVPALAVGDQEFSQSLLTWPADQRMPSKNLDSVLNDVDRRNGCLWCIF